MGDMADMTLEQGLDNYWDYADCDDREDDSNGYDRRDGSKIIYSAMTLVHKTGKAVLADTEKWGRVWMPVSYCVFDEKYTKGGAPAWLVGRWKGTGV